MNKNKINYQQELEKTKFDSNNAYDMVIGCLNRICVTDSEDEINRMVCGLLHNIEIISNANRKRIKIKEILGGKIKVVKGSGTSTIDMSNATPSGYDKTILGEQTGSQTTLYKA